MPHSFKPFDRSRLHLLPLGDRVHDLDIGAILPLAPLPCKEGALAAVARRIIEARERKAAVILIMGGHVIRSGVQRYLIDLIEKGHLTCVAMNGAAVIHDFEFSLIGATTENVARYIREGRFGLWKETGGINDVVNEAAARDMGMGEAVGRAIDGGDFPYAETSVLRAAWRAGIPATVHVGIGYDIIHEHPNFDGAACGKTSYRDFLILAHEIENLEGGVVMNFGSAVMAPEVYLKALAMARNISLRRSEQISDFTTLVCDLRPLPDRFATEPSRKNPDYFFRPWKTMLVRTVADGGESFYVSKPHKITIPALWTAIEEIANRR